MSDEENISAPADELAFKEEEKSVAFYASAGCVSGGCLLPFVLCVACGVLFGDIGGPLFWPIIAVPLGMVGMVIGMIIRGLK